MVDGKISRYLGQEINDTLTPGKLKLGADFKSFQVSGAHEQAMENNAKPQTLTPQNVVEQIRKDVVTVLGLKEGITGRFTTLEEQMIAAFEMIVRKGECPSIIVQKKPLFEALLCLKRFFQSEKTKISLDGIQNKTGQAEVLIFAALYHYAREAAYCDRKSEEIRAEMLGAMEFTERERNRQQLKQLKKRRDEALVFYQRIVFADAEQIRNRGLQRSMSIGGRLVSLDDLVKYYKSGGRAHRDSIQKAKAAPQRHEATLDSSLSMAHTSLEPLPKSGPWAGNNDEEVVEWNTLNQPEKKKSKGFEI